MYIVRYFWYTGLPKVTVIPSCQSVQVSQTAKFTATVSGVGAENFIYHWKQKGVDIQEEMGNALKLTNVAESDGGSYECIIWNEYGDCDTCSVDLEVTSKQTMISSHPKKIH